jgi:cytochrome c biogenesis protein CcmG, thiol:disulfide interchange protein DsbE
MEHKGWPVRLYARKLRRDWLCLLEFHCSIRSENEASKKELFSKRDFIGRRLLDESLLYSFDRPDHPGSTGWNAIGGVVDRSFGLALRGFNADFCDQFFLSLAFIDTKNGCKSAQSVSKEIEMKTVFLLVFILGFGIAQDQTAPDFRMYNTMGKMVARSSFLGKPVIVTFWATWCEVCQIEMPTLSKRFSTLKNKLVFLAVSRDGSQPANEVIAFIKPKKWTFSHVLVNPLQGLKDVDTIDAVTKRYGIYGQPWSFFIDAKGITRASRAGLSTDEQFRADLAKIGVLY